MTNDSIKEKFKKAKERLEKDPEAYEGIGEKIEEECGPQGPYFGPRNDIEYRKLVEEIRESGKDDD